MPLMQDAYNWAIEVCNAPNVGYSQHYRNEQTVNGITYYDCSSFINYALLAGGWETPGYAPGSNAFTTKTMANVLLGLGFREVSSKATYLPGDIGLSSSHTEMCYQGGFGKGVFMGAHTSKATLANQVCIGSSSGDASYQRSFPRLFRWRDKVDPDGPDNPDNPDNPDVPPIHIPPVRGRGKFPIWLLAEYYK